MRRYMIFRFESVITWAICEPSYPEFLRTVWIAIVFEDLFHCILGILVSSVFGNFCRILCSGTLWNFCDAVD